MTKPPAFQWYPKDILSSARVAELSLEEEGAYRRAMDYCWINGDLPADPERLARVIGKGCTPAIAAVVVTLFIAKGGSRVVHERLDLERKKQEDWRRKSAKGGKKSAEKRKKEASKRTNVNNLERSKGGSRVVEPPYQPKGNSSSSLNSKNITKKTSIQSDAANAASPQPDSPEIPVESKQTTSKRGTRLPPDFEPSAELIAWAQKECSEIDLRLEIDKFTDYWLAKPGQGGVKLDWSATWRNWMRNAKKFSGEQRNGRPQTSANGSKSHLRGFETPEELARELVIDAQRFKSPGIN